MLPVVVVVVSEVVFPVVSVSERVSVGPVEVPLEVVDCLAFPLP